METIWASVYSLNYKGRYTFSDILRVKEAREISKASENGESLESSWEWEKMGNDQNKSSPEVIFILMHNADCRWVSKQSAR